MTKISQHEARALRRRVNELETVLDRQRNAWALEWPGGVHITSLVHNDTAALVMLARKLGHAVVVTTYRGELQFRALPIAKETP